ncbi:MAG: hypothetical protein ACREO3_01005 [Arenimonas sp.]
MNSPDPIAVLRELRHPLIASHHPDDIAKRDALDAAIASLSAHANVHTCETCDGGGTIDETLGGIRTSNPKARCPDCHGLGEYYTAPPQVEVTEAMVATARDTFWHDFPNDDRDDKWYAWANDLMSRTLTAALGKSP